MCGHIYLDYQSHRPLQQHRPLWRCSACGRQSHRPLDCCTQPAYYPAEPNRMLSASVRWLRDLMSRMQLSIRSRLIRAPQPNADSALAEIEPLNTFLSEVEAFSRDGDLIEESPDRVNELQLR